MPMEGFGARHEADKCRSPILPNPPIDGWSIRCSHRLLEAIRRYCTVICGPIQPNAPRLREAATLLITKISFSRVQISPSNLEI